MAKQKIKANQLKASSAKLMLTGGQNIGNTTFTILIWAGEEWDTDNFSDGVNQTRATVPYTGLYHFTLNLRWSGATAWGSGRVIVSLRKNGASAGEMYDGIIDGSGEPSVTLDAQMRATAGDYYDIELYQASGAMKTLDAQTYLAITYMGEI